MYILSSFLLFQELYSALLWDTMLHSIIPAIESSFSTSSSTTAYNIFFVGFGGRSASPRQFPAFYAGGGGNDWTDDGKFFKTLIR
jgi:hypothetical protein